MRVYIGFVKGHSECLNDVSHTAVRRLQYLQWAENSMFCFIFFYNFIVYNPIIELTKTLSHRKDAAACSVFFYFKRVFIAALYKFRRK